MIALPTKFKNDIQGKDTYLTPLVVINGSIFLSTAELTMNGVHYNPFIKSVGSIKQSIDLFDKKFKVSSVDATFYNYEVNGKTLTDKLFDGEVMNTTLDIYYKSQSASALVDCLKAYSGYIKNIQEDKDTVTLEVEDRTEQTLHKDLPYKYTESEWLPEKQINRPIPIVYGVVDKCPLIYKTPEEGVYGSLSYSLHPDDFYIKSISNFQLFTNELYATIEQEAELFSSESTGTLYEGTKLLQFIIEEEGTEIIIDRSVDVSYGQQEGEVINYGSGTTISHGFVEVSNLSPCRFIGGTHSLQYATEISGGIQQLESKISSYKEINWGDSNYNDNYPSGQTPHNNILGEGLDPSYFIIDNFSTEYGDAFPQEMWSFGNMVGSDGFYYIDGVPLVLYLGESLFSFECVDQIATDNNILKEITENSAGDKSIVKSKVKIALEGSARIHHGWDINPLALPNFSMQMVDGSVNASPLGGITGGGWGGNPESLGSGDYLYSFSGESQPLTTENVIDNRFSLGERWLLDFQWEYQQFTTSVSMKYLLLNSLTIHKTTILKDFNSYDLYATVEGRVDSTDGRYTDSAVILSTEGRRQYYKKTSLKKPLSTLKRPSRPSPRKPVAKLLAKKKIKPKTTKGGY